MELIEGNYYSPHDLQTFMEVSESTWSHRRNELLSNLSLYYDYEVEYEGRKTTFHILKKLGDYQGIPNKRDASKRNNTYRSKIVEVIKAVEDTEYQILLEKRYLCFQTWEQIAVDMGYNVRHLYRIHEEALEKVRVPESCH